MTEANGRWQIIVSRAAERVLRRLPADLLRRIERAVDQLAVEPRPPGAKRLSNARNLYRIRVGDWRIIYDILEDRLVILIVKIGPRGDVYRDL